AGLGNGGKGFHALDRVHDCPQRVDNVVPYRLIAFNWSSSIFQQPPQSRPACLGGLAMTTDQDNAALGAFVLRISLGVMFLAHGLLLKVFVFGPASTAGFFESIGLPGALAYLTIAAETVGVLLLIAGVGTRYVV